MAKPLTQDQTRRIREKLKKILKTLIGKPIDAEYLSICQDTVLLALCPRCDHILASTQSASDRALQVIEVMILSLVTDLRGDNDVTWKSIRSLILFWFKYYGFPGAGRAIPSDDDIMKSLKDEEMIEQLLNAISKRLEELSEYIGDESKKHMVALPPLPDRLAPLVDQFSATSRRSFNDWINEAFELLASEIHRRAPQVFKKTKAIASPSTGVPTHLLELLRNYILDQCTQLPQVCGYGPSVECYMPRSFKTDIVRGSPVAPCSVQDPPELARQSGVLTGVPGSGRTAFLKHLAYSFVADQPLNNDSCFAFYIGARDFLAYAKTRQSVYAYIAERVFESQDVSQADDTDFRGWLEAQDKDSRLLLLVDDLDRLSDADRGEVVSQLMFCNAVTCATVPWQADEVSNQLSRQSHFAKHEMLDLSIDQQQELLVRLEREYPERTFDLALAHWVLEEVPFLAALPLGVMVVYYQALQHPGSRATIIQRALEVWFERAELRNPQFDCKDYRDEPMTYALLCVAQAIVREVFNRAEYPEESTGYAADFMVTRASCEHAAEGSIGFDFDKLMLTRLFSPVQGADTLCFVNKDIMCYVIALAIRHGWISLQPPLSWQSQTAFAQVVQQIESYGAAMWESSFEGLS